MSKQMNTYFQVCGGEARAGQHDGVGVVDSSFRSNSLSVAGCLDRGLVDKKGAVHGVVWKKRFLDRRRAHVEDQQNKTKQTPHKFVKHEAQLE